MAEINHESESGSPNGSATLQNGMIGGVVGLLLFFIPFSPFIGGFTGGYREGRTRSATTEPGHLSTGDIYRTGLKVGGSSGLLPFVFFATGWLYVFLTMLGWGTGRPPDWHLALMAITGCLILALYTISIGAAGGVFGIYVYNRRKSGQS